MVPIIHVFTEDDELRTTYWLGGVHLFKQSVRGRTTGTAFRGEQFNQNRMSIRARCLGSLGFVLDLQAPPVGGRRSWKE
jgi:hypothetical protein